MAAEAAKNHATGMKEVVNEAVLRVDDLQKQHTSFSKQGNGTETDP